VDRGAEPCLVGTATSGKGMAQRGKDNSFPRAADNAEIFKRSEYLREIQPASEGRGGCPRSLLQSTFREAGPAKFVNQLKRSPP
jgi:hypothetical protein